jgi:hypothetical protein
MKVKHYTEVPLEQVEGMPGVTVRWLVTEADGAPHFAMRVFEVPAGGSTEHHSHSWGTSAPIRATCRCGRAAWRSFPAARCTNSSTMGMACCASSA